MLLRRLLWRYRLWLADILHARARRASMHPPGEGWDVVGGKLTRNVEGEGEE